MSAVRRVPSPNHNQRPQGAASINAVLLHATEDRDTENAIRWCCTPKPANPNPVSYHSIVDRDATIIHLVDVELRAWHAGKGRFGDVMDVNNIAIGLSFANRNDGLEPYPEGQLAAGAALVAAWMKRFPAITMDRLIRHRDTALPVGRRTDPCPPAFDLNAFKLRVLRELTGGGGCI